MIYATNVIYTRSSLFIRGHDYNRDFHHDRKVVIGNFAVMKVVNPAEQIALYEYISQLFSSEQRHSKLIQASGSEDSIIIYSFTRSNMKVLVLFCVLATVTYVSGAVIPDVIYDDPIYELSK